MLDLLTLPETGIIKFENDRDKMIHLTYALCMPEFLAKTVMQLRKGCYKYRNLQADFNAGLITISVMEDVQNSKELRFRYGYYVDMYSNMGYTNYVKPRLTYKLKKEFVGREVRVCVVNSRGEKEILGRFKKEADAQDFILENYEDGKVYRLIYDKE